jgi:hypothetical protein
LVALRVVGVSDSEHRGHGAAGSRFSVTSRLSPQNGQTYVPSPDVESPIGDDDEDDDV